MATNAILAETIATIEEIAGDELATLTIERVVMGLFFSGVKLSSGHAGACATPLKTIPEAVCCPSSAFAMPFPGKMRGRPAADLLKEAQHPNGLRRAVGIAAMNALASHCWGRRPHPDVVEEANIDAFDAANIRPGQLVVVVGAFAPFLRELRKRGQPFFVLEQDPETLKPEEMPFYRPAEEAPVIVPQADVLLVTGTTLINDTLEGILAAARPDCCKVVVGPTVGLVPDAFLRRGCSVLGGIRITEADEFLDVLAEGGSGYHFFGKSAHKIVLRTCRPGEMRGEAA
ncbi:MAG: Fis family transcriptional regulator [Xanthobacteraceae bacterium]|nr:MAG: Fis family transcriptional regulator [Xanthobacteraceae bacterium]